MRLTPLIRTLIGLTCITNTTSATPQPQNVHKQLFDAVRKGKKEEIQKLLTNTTDFIIKDKYNDTLLHETITQDNREILGLLLTVCEEQRQLNKCVNTKNGVEKTPFILAAEKGKADLVKPLLETKQVIVDDASLDKLLERIITHNYTDLLKLLLEHNMRKKSFFKKEQITGLIDAYGISLLHWAALHGETAIAKLLLEQGANPALKNRFDMTPIDFAKLKQNQEMVTLLTKHKSSS